MEPVFEKDRRHKRQLNEQSEEKDFLKYSLSNHHPFSTTFIVFSIKNAEMLILTSVFLFLFLAFNFLKRIPLCKKNKSYLEKKEQEFKESVFFSFPLRYIFEAFLII